MTIGKLLVERLGAAEPAAASPLVLADASHSVELVFFDRDRYSVTLSELNLGAAIGAPADARAYLSAAAAAVARRLSFLEEPLAVWELDGSEGLAQLRSSPPQHEGDELTYWEVTLWADQPHAQLARYRWAPGMAERERMATAPSRWSGAWPRRWRTGGSAHRTWPGTFSPICAAARPGRFCVVVTAGAGIWLFWGKALNDRSTIAARAGLGADQLRATSRNTPARCRKLLLAHSLGWPRARLLAEGASRSMEPAATFRSADRTPHTGTRACRLPHRPQAILRPRLRSRSARAGAAPRDRAAG
ncbi:MAG: hypothetical protein U0Z44_15185 [Kouleothrix sp.]